MSACLQHSLLVMFELVCSPSACVIRKLQCLACGRVLHWFNGVADAAATSVSSIARPCWLGVKLPVAACTQASPWTRLLPSMKAVQLAHVECFKRDKLTA